MTARVEVVAEELRGAADTVAASGWNPDRQSLIYMLSIDAWNALVIHLGERLVVPWERTPGRTQSDVVRTLRAAADGAEGGGER